MLPVIRDPVDFHFRSGSQYENEGITNLLIFSQRRPNEQNLSFFTVIYGLAIDDLVLRGSVGSLGKLLHMGQLSTSTGTGT
jgi:hypothetical protein